MVPSNVEAEHWTMLCVTKNGQGIIPTRNTEAAQPYHDETGGIPFVGDNASSMLAYQRKLQTSSYNRGGLQQGSNMGHISRDGCNFVVNNRLIKLTNLLEK